MKIGITERGDAALDLSWAKKLDQVDGVVLITKDPGKLFNSGLIPPVHSIIHCTITGFGGSVIEPNVPKPEDSIKAYKELVKQFGFDRVVLRIDPIIPTEKGKATAIKVFLSSCSRIRISFIDQYRHIKERFQEIGLTLPWKEFHAPLELRTKVWEELGKPEICAEPGMSCSGCVSALDVEAMKLDSSKLSGRYGGQRPCCLCIAEKVELLKDRKPCKHGCVYCYWR